MWLANRLFPSVRRLQARLAALEGNGTPASPTPAARPTLADLRSGYIEWAHQTGCLFRIAGWSASDPLEEISLLVNGEPISSLYVFGLCRPDVADYLHVSDRFRGFGIEYLLPEGDTHIDLRVGNKSVYSAALSIPPDVKRHRALQSRATMPRDRLYVSAYEAFARGAVPPPIERELLELLDGCEGPLLDFGCGAGLLVQVLRSRGVDARGLDLLPMEPLVLADVRDALVFYDGSYPSPLPSGSFATVVCAEALEHIKDYAAAIEEMARLTRDRLIISVPDNNILQICEPFHLMPQHYLVADHYNFFSQGSLVDSLQPFFSSIRVSRTSGFLLEGVTIYSNLLVDCRK